MNRTDDECYTGTGPAAEVADRRFQKRPVEVSAWKIVFGEQEPEWVRDAFLNEVIDWCPAGEGLYINTLEGCMRAAMGDMLIKGVQGELYGCRSDIFEATYQAVDEGQPTYSELLAQRDELADALRWRDPDEEPPAEGQEVLVAFSPYNNPKYRRVVASAVFLKGRFLDALDDSPMHWPICWAPLGLPEALSRIKGA